MIDPNLVHRRSMMWLWWLLGVVLAGALLWIGATQIGGEATDLQVNPDTLAPAAPAQSYAGPPGDALARGGQGGSRALPV